jgi:predicted DNA-binding transcriptional regulator YafY
MRQALRNFRVDRIRSARPGDERFGKRRVALMKLWEERWQADRHTRRVWPEAAGR